MLEYPEGFIAGYSDVDLLEAGSGRFGRSKHSETRVTNGNLGLEPFTSPVKAILLC